MGARPRARRTPAGTSPARLRLRWPLSKHRSVQFLTSQAGTGVRAGERSSNGRVKPVLAAHGRAYER